VKAREPKPPDGRRRLAMACGTALAEIVQDFCDFSTLGLACVAKPQQLTLTLRIAPQNLASGD
jgi:hypothetical protein